MTARKPDTPIVRSRGTPVRVGTMVPGRSDSRDVLIPRTSRVTVGADETKTAVKEVARADESGVNKADDSIGARLDQWESLDERLRTNQENGNY